MLDPVAIPAFRDNYIWLLRGDDNRCLVVDPGDAAPVEAWLDANDCSLSAILITHHHPDHVGGLAQLTRRWPVPVYGPAHENIGGITVALEDGAAVQIDSPAVRFRVFEVPGHTLGHIAYLSEDTDPPLLFCGDTLFSGGCGRLFEGTPAQMHQSLQRLAALPDEVRVCCTHEYTLANLDFARAVLPQDSAVRARRSAVQALRDAGKPSLPSDIGTEKASNLFLRVGEPALQKALEAETGTPLPDAQTRFAALRAWKDRF